MPWAAHCHLNACRVSPNLEYLLVSAVHGIFMFSMLIHTSWEKVRASYKHTSTLRSKSAAQKQGCAAGALYTVAVCACALLCLAYSANLAWLVVRAVENGWNPTVILPSTASLTQVLAWLLMALVSANAKEERRTRFSWTLRTWWIVSFLLSALSFFFKITHSDEEGTVQPGTLVDMLALPICTFLSVIAIYGRTGIRMHAFEGLEEPLLNVCSDQQAGKKVTSYETAGFFGLMTFSWLDPLLATGYRKPLQLDDVPHLMQLDQASNGFELFKANWERLQSKSLLKCITLTLWKGAALNACYAGICVCASYVGPYLIDDFVEYLGGRRRFAQEGYVLASAFFIAKFIETLAQRQWFFGCQQLGLRVSAALTAMVYRKGLSLSNQSRRNHASGEIINYVSVDVQRIREFSWYIHELWLLPLQIGLAFTILFKHLGMAALAALGATALTMLANLPLSTFLQKFQTKIMESKDARMRATTEVLRSMRILKLQAWELRYMKKLEDLRKVEYGWLRRFLYAQATIGSLFWSTPAIVAVVTFSTCVFIGVPLTSGRVLSALAIFRVLQDPIYGIPDLVSMFAQTKVSLNRVQGFLLEPELDVHAIDRDMQDCDMAVQINGDACFSWDGSCEKPSIALSELGIEKGFKVAVCGTVGSGKSSLLSCFLGEIPKLYGSIKVNGSCAYVAQSAWIQTGKVQDNILFGKVMDLDKYENVLRVCALERDLELFAHGDQTIIGERGINLSGGQKQRIQLARALYQAADIYLLDDPFSAVDAHTGSHLFKECILENLRCKTVIYVTHQVEFLPAADLILVLEDGKVVQRGKFDELLQVGTNFSRLIGAHTKALESIGVAQLLGKHDKSVGKTDNDTPKSTQDSSSMQEKEEEAFDPKAARQIVQEEERETGRVSMAVYWSLITAVYKGAFAPLILLAQALFQLLQIASNYWMAWATPQMFEEHPRFDSYHVLAVFIGLAAASALCMFARNFLLSDVALKTAQKFFMGMLQSVFRAPMSFFDSTPTGRILNRASTDQSALDQDVSQRLAGLAFNVIYLIGIIAVMSQVAWPVFALFVPVMGISIWVQRYYIESARELARLVSIHKSPILHHFGESISGVATIRGFSQESRFMNANLELIDCYSRPLFYNFAAMEWLSLRLNMMANAIFAFALLLAVSLPEKAVDASIAGLAVTYGLNLTFLLSMVVWNLSYLEKQIISVERVQQYTQISSEAPLVIQNAQPPADWPCDGTISLENLQVRYAPHMPMVLRGITCTFWGGKKVGVVGRTGSGKSTLIQALFRIVEPAGGKILIDGIDICTIGLHDLRLKLSIIPQDPTMFEGTIRNNLDPLEEYTDAEIWKALEKSQLGEVVRAKDGKLNTPVSENGENWSVGQRQLVCLGRALLKRTKILVLDEATASVDTETDGVIQNTIRAEFTQCTVVTIAHRIPTVIDSDRVLLLSEGRVAEYDSPTRLLEDRASLFAKLVSEYKTR